MLGALRRIARQMGQQALVQALADFLIRVAQAMHHPAAPLRLGNGQIAGTSSVRSNPTNGRSRRRDATEKRIEMIYAGSRFRSKFPRGSSREIPPAAEWRRRETETSQEDLHHP